MWNYRALGLLAAVAGVPALADCRYETVVSSCYEFPEFKESHIINRNGDQTNLKSNEAYSLFYAYREKSLVRQVSSDGKGDETYDKVQNQHANFNGDSVVAVKKLAENFIATRQPWACKK